MKKHIVFALFTLALVLTLGSCKQNDDVSIVGTWTLATIQGAPVSSLGSSGTLVVVKDMTFTQNLSISGLSGSGTSSGTVTDNGSDSYTFKYTDDILSPSGYSATLSSSGKTLTIENLTLLGTVTWSK